MSTVSSISEVAAADWCAHARRHRATASRLDSASRRRDACAAGSADEAAGGSNPFLSHGFLRALEDSGSVAPRVGWGVQHLLAHDAAGQLVGAVPLYIKSHSYGCAANARRDSARPCVMCVCVV